MVTRDAIIDAVRAATEGQSWAIALWQGGSASFGRLDAWSDVDLGLGVEDGRVVDGFTAIEAAIGALSPITLTWEASPATDSKPQRYYRLRDADPFLIVDVAVLPRCTPPTERFVERRRHGEPLVLFDRGGFTADVMPDPDRWRARLRARLAWLTGRVGALSGLAIKSVHRGELAEAVAFYHAFTLRPLVEVLRMRHDPWRFDYDVRYLRFDVPEHEDLYPLWFPRDPDDLLAKKEQAEAWFYAEVARLDVDAIALP
jgi:hypothetical protein